MTIKKILLIILVLAVYFFVKFNNRTEPVSNVVNTELPVFSIDLLKEFDGSDPTKPIYIGYEGNVYDVSSGRDSFYGHGEVYNYLTGKDSTTELNIAGGSIIKSKYQIIGIIK